MTPTMLPLTPLVSVPPTPMRLLLPVSGCEGARSRSIVAAMLPERMEFLQEKPALEASRMEPALTPPVALLAKMVQEVTESRGVLEADGGAGGRAVAAEGAVGEGDGAAGTAPSTYRPPPMPEVWMALSAKVERMMLMAWGPPGPAT